jgi:hypothetical protein
MTHDLGHIFLNHTHADKSFVRRLASDLASRGVRVWLDEWELAVGDSIAERIQDGIKGAGFLGVVLSTQSVQSGWVKRELNAALAEELRRDGVFILPILIESCDVPLFIQDKVYADFRQRYAEGFAAVLSTVLPAESAPPKLIFDSVNDPFYFSWAVHCSDGATNARVVSGGPERLTLSASARQSVGLNKSIPTLHGRACFDYRVQYTESVGDHIYLAMIPIQETGYHRSGVVEVSTDRPADPRNPRSRHRLRFVIPADHQRDGEWHNGILDFDFRDTPTAFYSIFALRINEGSENPKEAQVELGSVRAYSW